MKDSHNSQDGHHDHRHVHHHEQGDGCKHGHQHNHIQGVHIQGAHVHSASNRILFALALNAIFTIIEFIGAYQFNSVAVLADAIHDGGDTLALAMAATLQFLALRPPNGQYTFGMRRLSLAAALLNGLLLSVGAIFVIVKAFTETWVGHQPVPAGMAALAVFGIVVNGAAVLRLRSGKSLNEQVLSLHLLEDVLGWVLVLVTAVVMQIVYLPMLDIALSIGLASFILVRAVVTVIKAARLFLEAVPEGLSLALVSEAMRSIKPVIAVHDMHAWSMDGEYHLLACHVVVPDDFSIADAEGLKKAIRSVVAEQGIAHVTIEIERESEDCGFEHGHTSGGELHGGNVDAHQRHDRAVGECGHDHH
jgi:cobalt-zinc-cadmium efflux system protein